jgi:hypothetical protein
MLVKVIDAVVVSYVMWTITFSTPRCRHQVQNRAPRSLAASHLSCRFLACRILMYLHCTVQIRRRRKETHRSPKMATDHRMRVILLDPLQIS